MKVCLCLPSHGGAFREHQACLGALRRAHPEWGTAELPGSPCVDIARSSVAESAIAWANGPDDVTLWLDADMTFSVETCETLVREASERRAVVGAVYSSKRFGGRPQASFLPGTKELVFYEGGGIIEIDAIGFGCVAVPSFAFEEIAKVLALPRLSISDQHSGITRGFRPWFTTDPTGKWDRFLSDDYAFCRRARETGIKIFADTRQRVGHIGSHTYFLEDAQPILRCSSFVIRSSDEKAAE